MSRRTKGPAKLDAQGRVRSATCESIGCPFLSSCDARVCAKCPGPAFFLKTHDCHDCPLRREDSTPDKRCEICPGPSDEANHHGASHVSLDSFEDGGEALISHERLITEGEPATIDLPPDEIDKAKAVLRYFTAMDEHTFGYVRGVMCGGEFYALYDVDAHKREALSKVESFTDGVEKRMAEVFLSMRADEFLIVKHLLAGGNLNTYASIYNTDRRYAHKKMTALMRRCLPEIRSIVKERKQPNGRVMKPRAEDLFQGDLFS